TENPRVGGSIPPLATTLFVLPIMRLGHARPARLPRVSSAQTQNRHSASKKLAKRAALGSSLGSAVALRFNPLERSATGSTSEQ
ncbi:MAG: hypothetical protein RBS02_14295, partial [Steroidobacteraceae bacterium]|nr:hypothetical protein [Steroidobacteraceae bacterium]